MSWFEELLISTGSIADSETKNINKRKQVVDKSLKKAQKGTFLQKPDKSLNKDIKKLNSDFNRAARKGSIKGMQKSVAELEKISKAEKRHSKKK